jgi:hypothetical protein
MSIEEIIELLNDSQWFDQYGNTFYFFRHDNKFYYRISPDVEEELRNCTIINGAFVCNYGYEATNYIVFAISQNLQEIGVRFTGASEELSDRILKRI